jgi:two-component system, NtrC family, response regulator PilR
LFLILAGFCGEAVKKILVVDDEPGILRLVTALLHNSGYVVSQADNGDAAKDLIGSGEYDLMISDIEMRPVSGIELLQFAREQKPSMPVLMITGYGDTGTAVEALKLGAFDYVTKPFRMDELLVTVKRALASVKN